MDDVNSGPVAVEVTVTGRVQGVSFRAYCAQEAERLGLVGWVRNQPDGSVRGHFEGAADAVAALVSWCDRGSPAARVSRVHSVEAEPLGLTGFESG